MMGGGGGGEGGGKWGDSAVRWSEHFLLECGGLQRSER